MDSYIVSTNYSETNHADNQSTQEPIYMKQNSHRKRGTSIVTEETMRA